MQSIFNEIQLEREHARYISTQIRKSFPLPAYVTTPVSIPGSDFIPFPLLFQGVIDIGSLCGSFVVVLISLALSVVIA
jgi:hypothetical protein